jgi:hypothetical protein
MNLSLRVLKLSPCDLEDMDMDGSVCSSFSNQFPEGFVSLLITGPSYLVGSRMASLKTQLSTGYFESCNDDTNNIYCDICIGLAIQQVMMNELFKFVPVRA